ncbi:MAG: type II secretion system protein [Duganella sp.]
MGVVAQACDGRHPDSTARVSRCNGFTMVELIMVMVLMGILAAVGVSRFFDQRTFEARAYADQAAGLIRYAQKLAIAQNRPVFVRSTPTGFAVCFDAGAACANANARAQAPGGSNNGSAESRAFCVAGSAYVANWACLGKPTSIAVNTTPARAEMAANGFFFFDAQGRPFNSTDAVGGASTFTALPITFTSGNQVYTVTVAQVTGYVF